MFGHFEFISKVKLQICDKSSFCFLKALECLVTEHWMISFDMKRASSAICSIGWMSIRKQAKISSHKMTASHLMCVGLQLFIILPFAANIKSNVKKRRFFPLTNSFGYARHMSACHHWRYLNVICIEHFCDTKPLCQLALKLHAHQK